MSFLISRSLRYPHGSGTKTPDYSSVSTYLALSYIAYAFTLSKQMLQVCFQLAHTMCCRD